MISADSDQTARRLRLISVCSNRASFIVGCVVRWLKYLVRFLQTAYVCVRNQEDINVLFFV